MKDFKGTPGPWEVEDNGHFYDINAGRTTVGDTCSSISWFDNDVHRGPVAKANARLIAAAPELLEALQMIMTGDFYMPKESADAARAAINKALGETK